MLARRTTLIVSAVICATGLSAQAAGVEESESFRRVLGVIFAEQQVHDSAWHVHRRAMELPVEERFQFLANWVLPGADHEAFRVAIDFSPTHPAPAMRGSGEEARAAQAAREGWSRIPTGGRLVSPALDLIESAAELERLPELRSRIERTMVRGELQERRRLAMLGLVDVALHDFDRALVSFDNLFARVKARTYDDFPGRWPETLAIERAIAHPETRNAAAELLYQMLQSQVREGVARGPDAWDRWVTATVGRLRSLTDNVAVESALFPQSTVDAGIEQPLRNWSPVSRTTAWSRGQGLPTAVWRVAPGMAENLASHDEDYLYYRIPLRGEFEVECDVNSFGWRDTHLMIAGTYVAPIYGHVTYGLGTFRDERPAGTIEPRLSECGDWIHYRAVVRDGACSTYFNGRLIHVEPLSPDHDPWIAVRSAWYADGAVRNLTIRGTPTIPVQIRLSDSDELTGWIAYHGEPVGGSGGYWRHLQDELAGGAILGQRESWLPGAAVERLLQYHRPMLEDGTIEYEFYYRDEDSHVHPALDRRAFVLAPDGVRTHWVTDGIFKRTGASPSAIDPSPENASPLPLRDDSWNQLRLSLEGDWSEIFLNDQLVHTEQIEPTNQRTFGLFHWADQTEVRVRNVVWTGAWPMALPTVREQDLAIDEFRFLDERLPDLTARFEHDFVRDGLPRDLIGVSGVGGDGTEASIETGRGVRMTVATATDPAWGWLSPKLRVHGDFDVRVEFERLETTGPIDSSCGIHLISITDDPEFTHSSVYRGTMRRPDTPDRQVMQTEFNRTRAGTAVLTWHGLMSEEATSGTLRLARRGDQIYCLFAEADSPVFRLVHKEAVATEPTIVDGLRLMGVSYSVMEGRCETAVTWKHFSIQAEQLTDVP